MHPNAYYYGMAQPGATAAAVAPAPAPATATAPVGTAQRPHTWYGNTKEEVDRQNMAIAQRSGANKPTQLVPQGASSGQTFWVCELNGTYTLRNLGTIQAALQPGYWAFAPRGGYPYFIRQKPAAS